MKLPDSLFDILIVLSSSPKHGYAIAQDIEFLHGGGYKPSIGMLYVGLQKLMSEGWIEEISAPETNEDSRRKFYQLTPEGLNVVTEEFYRKKGYIDRINHLLHSHKVFHSETKE